MQDRRSFIAQRISALIMVPLVLGHLALIVYVVRGGLSVVAILERTQGSLFWGAFYGLFVLAAAVHGAIGLRVILAETAGLRGRASAVVGWLAAFGLAWLGLRAVYAVVVGP